MEKDLAAGGFKAYRHIAAILRLMEYCEGQHRNNADYTKMSDEELLYLLSHQTLE